MPGFINCHGHAAMSLFKGLADDLPLMTWLEEHIWPAEGQWVSPEFVADGTKLAIAEMLKSGTTCFSDMYFFPEVAAEVAAEYGIRGIFYGPILDFPTPYGSGADEYIEKIVHAHDTFKHHPLIDIGFGPHAPYTVSDEPIKKVRSLADQLSMPIQIHLHETEFEVADAIEKTGQRPSERLRDLGFWGPDVQAVHVTQANEVDQDIFKEHNVHIIHCPESNLKLASGFCPVDELQQKSINVALGTDGAASNNDLDMLGEMHTAALLAKGVSKNASALPAIEAIKMATINGARALGKENEIGSLKIGKQADIISFDFNTISCAPVYDPISHIVYSTNASQVDHVWVAGKLQVQNKQLCHFNTPQLIEMAQNWADKIRPNKD
jgi:5-methylthioadenosine/S-adenosylhomocysteine deaminase